MSEVNWSSGKIKSFNPERKTGTIISYDGDEILFHITDVEKYREIVSEEDAEVMEEVAQKLGRDLEGSMVFFQVENTKLGPQARDITFLATKA